MGAVSEGNVIGAKAVRRLRHAAMCVLGSWAFSLLMFLSLSMLGSPHVGQSAMLFTGLYALLVALFGMCGWLLRTQHRASFFWMAVTTDIGCWLLAVGAIRYVGDMAPGNYGGIAAPMAGVLLPFLCCIGGVVATLIAAS